MNRQSLLSTRIEGRNGNSERAVVRREEPVAPWRGDTVVLPRQPGAVRGWPATPGVQRWVLAASDVSLREKPSDQSDIVCRLSADTEFDCLALENTIGEKWCEIRLEGGQHGYIRSKVLVRRTLQFRLDDLKCDLHSRAEADSGVVRQLARNDTFLFLETVKQGSEEWTKVRLADGQEGFLLGKPTFKAAVVKAPNSAEHDMVVGGLWCVGGIVVTVLSYQAVAEKGGSYFVAWGAVLFGGIQFLKGLARASSGETPTPQATVPARNEIAVAITGADLTALPQTGATKWYHVLAAIFLPFIALPWGIVSLTKKRTVAALATTIVSAIVLLVVGLPMILSSVGPR